MHKQRKLKTVVTDLTVFYRKMYLANWTEGSVEVLGMDGTRLQRLVSGLKQPRSLTIDLYGNERQLYWLESVDHKGQRSTTIVKACYLENG